MKARIWQIDAFTNRVLTGNPAAVVPFEQWLADEALVAIAAENNLSETAFLVNEAGTWRIRWFTPVTEVKLCGHATLAAAHVPARPRTSHRASSLGASASTRIP